MRLVGFPPLWAILWRTVPSLNPKTPTPKPRKPQTQQSNSLKAQPLTPPPITKRQAYKTKAFQRLSEGSSHPTRSWRTASLWPRLAQLPHISQAGILLVFSFGYRWGLLETIWGLWVVYRILFLGEGKGCLKEVYRDEMRESFIGGMAFRCFFFLFEFSKLRLRKGLHHWF